MHYLEVKDLSFYYDQEPVLSDISFDINPGEFVILTGENGAAKSTLIKTCLGLLKPNKGSVVLSKLNKDGQTLRIGYIPQQIASFNAGFPSTVIELVKSGRYVDGKWFKKLNEDDYDHVQKALESVGMWSYRNKRVGELSGGQKQRIAIARMFASDPDFFVLDEPITGMDKESRTKFYKLMHHNAHTHGKAVLMVTHNTEDVIEYADRHIRLVRDEDTTWNCFNLTCEDCRKLGDQ